MFPDGAVRSEKPANEENRNNVLPSLAVSVKDVLAQSGGNAMLPCRFSGPGIVSTPNIYVHRRTYVRSVNDVYKGGGARVYEWTPPPPPPPPRPCMQKLRASGIVYGYYVRADEHQGSVRIVPQAWRFIVGIGRIDKHPSKPDFHATIHYCAFERTSYTFPEI